MKNRLLRAIAISTLVSLALVSTNMSVAAVVKTPPYDSSEEPTNVQNDISGLATGNASASANKSTGALTANTSAQGTAPVGASVPYSGVGVGTAYAAASPRFIQYFAATGGSPITVDVQLDNITAPVQTEPAPQYDPVTGYYCLNCTSYAYATTIAEVSAYFYPCAPISAYCYSDGWASNYIYLDGISNGSRTLSISLPSNTAAVNGTLQVLVSLVSISSISGEASASAQASTVVSSITVN